MKVDFVLPGTTGPGGAPALVARAKTVGFDGAFSVETAHDPFLQLAAGIPHGEGMDFGTAIAVAFPRSPMNTAMIAWDLQRHSGGHFILGLGTQIKAHITRRFSATWDSPGPRLREYIESMRAIWRTWQEGEALSYKGEFYQFSLMTPFFDPGPIEFAPPKVFISAVGPFNCRLVGTHCDGIHIHAFHTEKYLDEFLIPAVKAGADEAGRSLDEIQFNSAIFVVTGRDEAELEASKRGVKQQIAFYASTPAYRGVLDIEGWDFGPKLTAMSKRGKWEEMADVIEDEVLERFAVVGPVEDIGPAIRARYAGRLDRVSYYTIANELDALTDEELSGLVAATKG